MSATSGTPRTEPLAQTARGEMRERKPRALAIAPSADAPGGRFRGEVPGHGRGIVVIDPPKGLVPLRLDRPRNGRRTDRIPLGAPLGSRSWMACLSRGVNVGARRRAVRRPFPSTTRITCASDTETKRRGRSSRAGGRSRTGWFAPPRHRTSPRDRPLQRAEALMQEDPHDEQQEERCGDQQRPDQASHPLSGAIRRAL